MSRIEVVVCNVCKAVGTAVTEYRVQIIPDGEATDIALCDEHDQIANLLETGSPRAKSRPSAPIETKVTPRRRRGALADRHTTVEALKAGRG